MKTFTWMQRVQNAVQYLGDGVSRLFRPTDDDYPTTGVQPYSGEPTNDTLKFY